MFHFKIIKEKIKSLMIKLERTEKNGPKDERDRFPLEFDEESCLKLIEPNKLKKMKQIIKK